MKTLVNSSLLMNEERETYNFPRLQKRKEQNRFFKRENDSNALHCEFGLKSRCYQNRICLFVYEENMFC